MGNQNTDNTELQRLREELQKTKKRLKHVEKQYRLVISDRDRLQEEREILQSQFDIISNAEFWKITKPLRSFFDVVKRIFCTAHLFTPIIKFTKYAQKNGLRAAIHKSRLRNKEQKKLRKLRRIDLSKIPAEQRNREANTTFDKDVCFSIVVPLYNTPIRFLKEMISSVIGQTYSKWELCLADGSDSEHGNVEKEVLKLAENDSRIKYQKLESNMGISENTNACLKMTTGNYIALFDHDDILHPSALYEMMKAICEKDADYVYTDEATFESPNIRKIITYHLKPDYAIDNLRANNYICHFSAFSREILNQAGAFRAEYDGSQDHDMILRLTSYAKNVVHIPKLLYFWRSHPMSVAMDINSKTYAIEAGKRAVRDNIKKSGYDAEVESSRAFPTIYRIRYKLKSKDPEKVSIIIPNKNNEKLLKKCLQSIMTRTTYPNYEIIIVDNGSNQKSIFNYYESLKKYSNIQIVSYDQPFNYSAINNYGVQFASGKYFILLNNDIQIITRRWIEEMLMYVQRDDVGAAGAMLYYPDNTIQHAGIIMKLGSDRIAGHAFHKWPRGTVGYMGRLCYAQNMSAVTAACMMVKASVYKEVGGFDETYPVAFNDVDFCLKIRKSGKLIVWTPYAEAYHYESKTRGRDDDNEERIARFKGDCQRFREKWEKVLNDGDPYYNCGFSLDTASFDINL